MNKDKIWIVAVVAIIMSVSLIVIGCMFDTSRNCHGEKNCIHSWYLSGNTAEYSSCGYFGCDVYNSAGDSGSPFSPVMCDCK